jgi:hypothetical protein
MRPESLAADAGGLGVKLCMSQTDALPCLRELCGDVLWCCCVRNAGGKSAAVVVSIAGGSETSWHVFVTYDV